MSMSRDSLQKNWMHFAYISMMHIRGKEEKRGVLSVEAVVQEKKEYNSSSSSAVVGKNLVIERKKKKKRIQKRRRMMMYNYGMEIRFIEFFLTLNKNSITLSIVDDVYYAMLYVDDECVNVFLTNSFSLSAFLRSCR